MELIVQNKYMNMGPSPNYWAGYGRLYGLISSGIINSWIIIFFSDLVSFHWQGQESQVLKKTKIQSYQISCSNRNNVTVQHAVYLLMLH